MTYGLMIKGQMPFSSGTREHPRNDGHGLIKRGMETIFYLLLFTHGETHAREFEDEMTSSPMVGVKLSTGKIPQYSRFQVRPSGESYIDKARQDM